MAGFFNTLRSSRRFRQHLNSRHDSRIVEVPQFSIPEIYVDDDGEDDALDMDNMATTPVASSPLDSPQWDRSPDVSPRSTRHLPRIDTAISSDDPLPPDASPSRVEWANIGSLSPHRGSRPTSSYDGGGDLQGGEISGRARAESSVSVQGVMDSFDNSAWGESIRRSFTLRRSPGGGSR